MRTADLDCSIRGKKYYFFSLLFTFSSVLTLVLSPNEEQQIATKTLSAPHEYLAQLLLPEPNFPLSELGREASIYYSRGIDYYNKGAYEQAIEDFSRAAQFTPGFAPIYIARGATYVSMHNQEMKTRIPEIEAEGKGGVIITCTDESDLAEADFYVAAKLDQGIPELYYWRGLLNASLDRVNQSSSDFEKYLQLSPNSPNRAIIENVINFMNSTGLGPNQLPREGLSGGIEWEMNDECLRIIHKVPYRRVP